MIKYSYFSKTQSGAVHCASGVIKTQIKILEHITWNSVILEHFLKDKPTKKVVSEKLNGYYFFHRIKNKSE